VLAFGDLKELERRAFRSYYQDGLWDMYLGTLLVVNFAAAAFFSHLQEWAFIAVYSLLLGCACFLFWAGKKWITVPRLGEVHFGAARKTRKKWMGLLLGVALLVNAALVVFTWLMRDNPGLVSFWEWFGSWLAWGIGAWVALIIILIGYFSDFQRLMVYGIFFGAAFTAAERWGTPYGFLAIGSVMILIGLVYFVRFLQKHPVPGEAA